ncbi:MAG TPA: hypothetical protein PLS58_04500 [Bacteroidales bacterium]|jgi:hypothetical protein|nr:hypothetical protein [Bacteroidales bacterium]
MLNSSQSVIRAGYIHLFIFFAISLNISCKKNGSGNLDQGEIHYHVEYPENSTILPPELMPKAMVVSFKDNNLLFELISPFGNSGITNLSNPSKKIYDTYFSLFTIKCFYPAKPGETYPGFESMEGMQITKTPKTAIICGMHCKNAEVTVPSVPGRKYNIWYTNEIPVSNPNASTPYAEIDGVLMSFFYLMGKSEFHFEAVNIYRKKIPDEAFDRRSRFNEVSRTDLIKFISKMVSL